jgi:hypothetical protein
VVTSSLDSWTITRLPSEASRHAAKERANQRRDEHLARTAQRLKMTRDANGIPDPSTWMW